MGDGSAVGAGSFDCGQYGTCGAFGDPGDGSAHASRGGRKGFARFSCTCFGVDDGVGVGLCVGVCADDVVEYFCNDGHDGFAFFSGWLPLDWHWTG